MKLILAFAAAAAMVAAQSPGTGEAWDHFYNLEFDQAIEAFSGLIDRQPGDPALHNHLAQCVLFSAMLKAGALESELVTGGNSFLRREKMQPTRQEQDLFEESIATAMRLSQAMLDRDPDDRTGLYNLGVAHGLRANWNFLVRKSWLDSLRDATAGRKLHNRLSELEPGLIDARMMQGAHDYVVGSLPWYYKVLGFLAGFRGDRDGGIATLKLVAQRGERNRDDAKILLATIYRRERRPEDAVPLLKDLIAHYPRNYLLHLELAQMYADLGKRALAFETVDEVERMKRAGLPGFETMPVEKVYYFRGIFQFWFDNPDAAIENLRRVTAKADELDPNTGVTAWMRLGQSYDLKGMRKEAIAAYREAMAYAPDSDPARESSRYLREPYRRNKG